MNEPVYPYTNEHVCVVVHDAGAGNLILSEVRTWSPKSLSIAAFGPSRAIAKTLFPEVEIKSLSSAMLSATLVVTGTSHNSDEEHLARKAAINAQVYCMAGVDHWVNYKKRFCFGGEYLLPNEILVSDFAARVRAIKAFPDCKVREVENKYLSTVLYNINCMDQNHDEEYTSKKKMLYVLEPLRGSWVDKLEVSATTMAFELFLDKLFFDNIGAKLRVRLHPSQTVEDISDITALIKALPNAELSQGYSLAEDISWSTSVIGCETYALFVALCANREVFSSLPHAAPSLRLPFPEICELRQI